MKIRSTTILCVRQGNQVAMGSDGQVTVGNDHYEKQCPKVEKTAP